MRREMPFIRFTRCRMLAVAVALFGLVASSTHAGIVITGTRVIYPAQEREVTVRLKNSGSKPALVQAWIDDGHEASKPSDMRVPFALLPSVFRVEPQKGQSLRILFTGASLPQDRESVYYLNVLEIPPKPKSAESGRNTLQFAFRTRMKLFYRPVALTEDPSAVTKQLRWSFRANEKGERVLRMENPSPYYVSMVEVKLKAAGQTIDMKPEMAPPFGHVDFVPMKGALDIKDPKTIISYGLLNDYGATVDGTAQMAEAGS